MKYNRVLRVFAMLFVAGFLATLFFFEAYSESPPASQDYVHYLDIRITVGKVEREIEKKSAELQEMVDIRTEMVDAIAEIDKKSRMNAIQSVVARMKRSVVPAIMALLDQIDQTKTALDLVPKLEKLNMDIDEFPYNYIDTDIYQRKPDGYNAVWDKFIKAYNKLEGKELQLANQALLSEMNR